MSNDDDTMSQHAIGGGSGYQFSATKISSLGASEYTIFNLAIDVSGSVEPFAKEIEGALKSVIESCASSPRADNLMARVVLFDHELNQLHGFKPLADCHIGAYNNAVNAGGGTALYDAVATSVDAVAEYGRLLVAQDYVANGIVVVVTDGRENGNSKHTVDSVKETVKRAVQGESLESITTILVGVNAKGSTAAYLEAFQKDVGFDRYIGIEDASPKSFAKVAGFISQSVSSVSQSLQNGGPSQPITF